MNTARRATPELAPERMERLRAMLRSRPFVRAEEVRRALGVSASTARRDLLAMEKAGEVRRVHGGAMRTSRLLEEPLFDNKETQAAAEKQRIARAALAFVEPDGCVFLDGGSTVLALARLLRDQPRLTVLTNSLRVAMELASEGPRLILVGGELRRLSQTFVGPLTRFLIEQIHVDVAFMGTIGVAREAGMTTTDSQEAYTKSLMISRAEKVVLLADGSKIGRVSFARFGALDSLHALITDRGAPAAALSAFRKKGVKVILA